MDWIDEKLEKLKRWIYHADLKKALIFYICIAVASAALATVLTAQICSSWIEVLLTPYSEIELIRGIDQEGHPVFFPSQEDIPGIAPICYSGSNVFGGVGNLFLRDWR